MTPPKVRKFCELLCAVENGPTVILIDEYEYDYSKHPEIIDLLKSLFLHIKEYARYIKVVFATGTTRNCSFLESDFRDISSNTNYRELAGVTKAELKKYFHGHIDRLAKHRNLTPQETEEKLKEWYDGYAIMKSLFNPTSRYSDFRK